MNQSEEFQKSQTAIDYNWKKSAKSAIEKLDIVLSALDHEGASPEGYSDILKKDSLVAVSISMRELHQIIQKLQTDKYVDLIQSANSTTKSFYITIEGEFFIQEGGYQNKRKKEKRLKT